MSFSKMIWEKTSHINEQIIALPFNQELANGALNQDVFCYYIEQDAYYLLHFARALALIAGRSQNPATISDFLKFSNSALIAEQEVIHSHYLDLFKYQKTGEFTLSCFAYTNFLIAHASSSPLEVAISSVVPCFWIYREVGKHIHDNYSHHNNPYHKWIDTYASKAFDEAVNKVIAIMDECANKANEDMRLEMEKAFTQSSLMEWHFWNDAYYKKNISLPKIPKTQQSKAA